MGFKIKSLIVFFVTVIFCYLNPVFGQSADTIFVNPEFRSEEIGPHCFHRIGSEFKAFFLGSKEWSAISVPSYRLSPDKTHWIFVPLKNTGTIDRSLKLYLNNVQAGFTKMYAIVDGKIDSMQITGSLLPADLRASMDRTLSIPFIIPAGKTTGIYLKSQKREIGITLTLTVSDPAWSKAVIWEDYLLLTALVFIFVILITAIFILAYSPSRETFWFLVYIFFGFLYVLAASGFGSLYFWSSFPWFEENASVFLGAVSTTGFFEFSRRILKTRYNYPLLNVLLLVFSVGYPVIGFLGFGLYFNLFTPGVFSRIIQVPYLIMLICFGATFCVSVYEAVFKQKREFWWFVSIFSFYVFFSIVTILLEIGFMRYNYQMHAVLLALGVLPQMTLTLLFLINRMVILLKKRTREIAEIQVRGKQAMLDERLRISRELHDEVGSTLSGIAMYSHLTTEQIKSSDKSAVENSLNIIQQSSAEMVNKLNDIVWLINPGQDSLQKLVQRLEEYASDMAMIKNMEVKVQVTEKLSSIELPIESRRNIYLFCKEAINNAVKYSNGTLLELCIEQTDGKLEFLVRDNGKGFDVATVKRGNGLDSMQKRSNDIGATKVLRSGKGEGSSVAIQLKSPDGVL